MKDFQIVRYVSSWKYLIALCTVIGGVVFYSYFSRQQVYTAYAIISYTNLDAKSGKTPSGADIDVSEIYSPNVVADAIEKLESNVSVDFVRSRIKVEPIVSDEEQKRKEADKGMEIGPLKILPRERRVFVADEEKFLSNKEFDLLLFLAENPNIVFSKDTLFERIWGLDAVGNTATVTVHINRLREKLESGPVPVSYIQTVWGAGYRFKVG